MSCTVFKSTNAVDQSVNVFPPKGYISNVRVLKNDDVDGGYIFKFRSDVARTFKATGATLTCPSNNVLTPVTEVFLNPAQEIIMTLDEGRDYAYLSWNDTAGIMGFTPSDGSAFFGAYVDYSLGLHTENATSIAGLLMNVGGFNQRVDFWNLSEVTQAAAVFYNNRDFNREIKWNAPKLNSLTDFLRGASKFNKNITIRNAKPLSVAGLLDRAISFNSKINIDTSECSDFTAMCRDAESFNQSISNLDFRKAVRISNMLEGARSFNQIIDFGTLPLLEEAQYLFASSALNSPVKFIAPKLWNVSGLFSGNAKFNSTITVDFSSATTMSYFFFLATSFNQPISHFNIKNVLNFEGFLTGAPAFNQDLSAWPAKFNVNANIVGVSEAQNWSTENYDKYLNALWLDVGTTRQAAWANGTSPRVVNAVAKRSAASQAAVSGLIGAGWTIVDGGLV
ncbi:BspA family leucine-rich repeat surface protein [Acinetobacter sp. 243_ASPC]|uniref:BspA family leucine-rich repeat surface protein n=1 Tax=Acinetobacter sp. 243_ASPC TaxID=1579345 RepID=UPI00065F7D0B|nr:BspA family leucine-rich repeat surface protein [Acinetobacter sp. 243_ASPC]